MKLLFIDHECHKRTGSAAFFLEIVRKVFGVDEHYYAHHYKTDAEKVVSGYDGAIIWEFPVSRRKFFFPGKCNVFVPMYDNEWASYWQWKRIAWSGMGVVSFCDKVSEHARRCGVTNILDVRYFPDPTLFPQEKGDPKRVFLWERGAISKAIAERLFPPDDGYSFDVKSDGEFLGREEYLGRIAKCGIIIAPRMKEGIGMAFLEAMAMGKCVVAHNDATMNEYIVDGENGILFDMHNPTPVPEAMVSHIQANVGNSIAYLRCRWINDAKKIADFIGAQLKCSPNVSKRLKLFFSYPLYLVEGAFHILTKKR